MGVFGSAQKWNGSFKASLLKVQFGPIGTGMLVQNVQFTFSQQVNLLFEIGSENAYYVGGRAQGTAGVQRIMGPGPSIANFFTTYGDICSPEDITFRAQGGCGGSQEEVSYIMKEAVLQQVGGQVTAQEIVITESLQLIYIDLERN
jgi:hypothetical protein